jgi:E3 ubiquitin-protein ligase RNF14
MADEFTEDDRSIELSSITAIFPEIAIDPSDPFHASLEIPVTPLRPLRISFNQPTVDTQLPQSNGLTTNSAHGAQNKEKATGLTVAAGELHELEHLPSIKLDLTLPEGYPSQAPPRVFLVADQQWLPRKKLQELEADCARLWEEWGRDQVIFTFIDHIQQQAETAFGLADDEKTATLPADIKVALLDHNLQVKREIFERELFHCEICLEPKKGKDCHKMFLCGHVTCSACLIDFYTSCITEGDIDNVKCITFGCGKDETLEPPRKKRRQDRTLNPSELLQIPLKKDLVQRYVRLKRKKKLESSKYTIYCPRQWCQGPAYPEHRKKKEDDDYGDFDNSDEEEEEAREMPKTYDEFTKYPMSKRLAICSDCRYAFCWICRKTWHGTHKTARIHCNPRDPKMMAAEEQATAEYLKRYSTPCPTCDSPCQKTHGCNHMTCFQCKTHFCYLCSSYLNEGNPYSHFNQENGKCYMRLWELEEGDEEGVENFRGGGRPIPAPAPVVADADDRDADNGPAAPAEDSDDSEHAPDVRRRSRAIEFVNFANPAAARRINIPDQEREVPPAAPEPPPPQNGRRARGPQPNQPRPGQNNHVQHGAQPARQLVDINGRVAGNNGGLAQQDVRHEDDHGLQRFLGLAIRDEEDGWDSDELEDLVQHDDWNFR